MLGDLIRRALELEGVRVTQIMNITDVGHMTDEASPDAVDKMLLAVEDEGLAPLDDRREVRQTRSSTRPRPSASARRSLPEGDRAHPRDDRADADADRSRPRLRGRLRAASTSTSSSFPGYGTLSGNTLDNLREGHRDLETDPAKRHPADFALWKAAGPGRLMKWDSPWGDGLPGLAHRVLGDVDEVPGRAVRHPHRRQRPAVPPSRGRDRAERGRGRASGGLDLGARWPPAPVGAEDLEVHGQHDPGGRPRRAGRRSAVVPVAHVPDALPLRDGLHVGGDGGRRREGQAAPPAHGRVGRGRGGARRARRGRSTRGSGTRSRPTSTCRRPWSS